MEVEIKTKTQCHKGVSGHWCDVCHDLAACDTRERFTRSTSFPLPANSRKADPLISQDKMQHAECEAWSRSTIDFLPQRLPHRIALQHRTGHVKMSTHHSVEKLSAVTVEQAQQNRAHGQQIHFTVRHNTTHHSGDGTPITRNPRASNAPNWETQDTTVASHRW